MAKSIATITITKQYTGTAEIKWIPETAGAVGTMKLSFAFLSKIAFGRISLFMTRKTLPKRKGEPMSCSVITWSIAHISCDKEGGEIHLLFYAPLVYYTECIHWYNIRKINIKYQLV